MQNTSKFPMATSASILTLSYSWSVKLILMLYLSSMISGLMAASAASSAAGQTETATPDPSEELAPDFDCLSEDCSEDIGHQMVARSLDRNAIPPAVNPFMYSLLRELETTNFAGSQNGRSMAFKSIPLPLALQILQRVREHSATNDQPLIITPIRKQRGNQLKMANRFGKRDRLRMSNRFGRK